MSNIELLFFFFCEGAVWFLIFFILWMFYFGIKSIILRMFQSKYQCPSEGCLGCKYLDLSLSKVDGATWHCMLGRKAENPFKR